MKTLKIFSKNIYKMAAFLIAGTVTFTGCTGTINNEQITQSQATSNDDHNINENKTKEIEIRATNTELLEDKKLTILVMEKKQEAIVAYINITADNAPYPEHIDLENGTEYVLILSNGTYSYKMPAIFDDTLTIDCAEYVLATIPDQKYPHMK